MKEFIRNGAAALLFTALSTGQYSPGEKLTGDHRKYIECDRNGCCYMNVDYGKPKKRPNQCFEKLKISVSLEVIGEGEECLQEILDNIRINKERRESITRDYQEFKKGRRKCNYRNYFSYIRRRVDASGRCGPL